MAQDTGEEMLVRYVGERADGPAIVVLTSPTTGMSMLDATAATRAAVTAPRPDFQPMQVFAKRFATIDRRG